MGIPSQKPDPGRRKRIPKWDYFSIPNGKTTLGFLAAHPTGAYGHQVPHFKPCRHRMSLRTLKCALCEAHGEPIWRGFTPYYDQQYTRRFVVIPQELEESVCEISPKEQIELSRASSMRAPVVVKAKLWRTTPLPPSADRDAPFDMMDFLVGILWKDPVLIRFHQGLPVTDSDTAVTPHVVEESPTGNAVLDAMEREGPCRVTLGGRFLNGPDPLKGIGTLPDGSPGRNGKHKPK